MVKYFPLSYYRTLYNNSYDKVCFHEPKDSLLVTELAGAMTHKIPSDKKGIILNQYDMDGKNVKGPQWIVQEKTAIPLVKSKCKENKKATEYIQQGHIAKKIIQILPQGLVLSLKNTSEIDSPLDDGF